MKIKLGGFSSSRTKEYIWVRLGDISEYDKVLNPYDAGINVGSSLPPTIKFSDLSFNYKLAGVEIPPDFVGPNYISLFLGDRDAQWIRDLSDSEKSEFERGVHDGLTWDYDK